MLFLVAGEGGVEPGPPPIPNFATRLLLIRSFSELGWLKATEGEPAPHRALGLIPQFFWPWRTPGAEELFRIEYRDISFGFTA